MHANSENLLSLRDGEPVAAPVAQHVANCVACQAQLAVLQNLRARLQALPDTPLPDGIAVPVPRRNRRHWAGVAAVLVCALVVGALLRWQTPAVIPDNQDPGHSIAALQRESRQLETLLDTLRPRGQVLTAATAATVADLQDSIAVVDWQLSQSATTELTPQVRHALWQQRVGLMESLVTVQYTEASRNSF